MYPFWLVMIGCSFHSRSEDERRAHMFNSSHSHLAKIHVRIVPLSRRTRSPVSQGIFPIGIVGGVKRVSGFIVGTWHGDGDSLMSLMTECRCEM